MIEEIHQTDVIRGILISRKYVVVGLIFLIILCTQNSIVITKNNSNIKHIGEGLPQYRNLNKIQCESTRATEWKMFHHDAAHSGKTDYNGPISNIAELWSFSTTVDVKSSPAVVNNLVYFQSDKVYCLYANNGTKKETVYYFLILDDS